MSRDVWLGVELRHFAALAAIAREGTFRGAADRLGYVQSAVSHQLAVLERIVGARLVARAAGAGPLTLTPAGEVLLRHADDVLAHVAAAKADLGHLDDERSGTVRVGVVPGVAARFVPPLLSTFAARYPGVGVCVEEWATDVPVLQQVQDGRLDLGFGWLPLEPGPFAHCELLSTPIVLLVPTAHPLARRRPPVSVRELARLPLIGSQQSRVGARIEQEQRAAGRSLRVRVRSDCAETTRALVAEGLGVALVPRLAFATGDPRVAFVELAEPLARATVALFWHRDRLLSEAAQELGEVAREIAG
jgi:DNA-binding transcriptional LysR family regulator